MLEDTININNLCCNQEVLKKKVGKKIAFFGANLHKKEVIMGSAQDGKFFFGRNQKFIISFQKVFILSKYHMF